MKVSVNWVKDYTELQTSVDQLVTKIGAQLGAVEETVDLGRKYDGALIVHVVSCEKHPNADRLNVCKIDDGGKAANVERDEDGLVQVVCGAPNVRAGLFVVWLPPGATVPSSFDTDPFVLEARELRGVISNGMLASPQELAVSEDHGGLLELDEATPGESFAHKYGLDDYVIDIENKMFTHRPDCFGILGVAREIAGIQQVAFTSPDWYLNAPTFVEKNDLPLTVKNELPVTVPRFMAVAVKNVTIKPSPLWLQVQLTRVGLKPINNIVDITNLLSYLTAQPLHAYDYDKVTALSNGDTSLVVRNPVEGEKIALLSGKEITPRSEAIMIATDKELIGVGGVMGGSSTEVDDATKNIILECASFNMYSIRRTSMVHGLFTDAVTRFNKGQSPLQNDRVIAEALRLAVELSGGEQASSVIDDHHLEGVVSADKQHVHEAITVSSDFINQRLGVQLNDTEITTLLRNVEFSVESVDGQLLISAPFWRTDIEIPEDIVEEVGRLYDFGRLPLVLPSRSMTPAAPDAALAFKSQLRHSLARLGANEVLTYSFVHGNLLDRTLQDKSLAFKLSNALSPDLQYYRMSLTPSLLSHVHSNVRAGYDHFALFEIGKAHINLHADDDHGVPKEFEILSLVVTNKSPKAPPAYYEARKYLDELARSIGIELTYTPIDTEIESPITKPFDVQRSALVTVAGTEIGLGIVGEYKASVRTHLKLPVASAGFEIGLSELINYPEKKKSYRPLSRFPSISQDLCLQVPSAVRYGDLATELQTSLTGSIEPTQSIEQWPIDIYSDESLQGQKRITYRIKLTSYERTLTEDVLTRMLETATVQLGESLGAVRI